MPGSLYFGTSKVCPVILKNEPALPSYQITGSGAVSSKSMALTGDEFSNVTSVNSYGFSYAFYKFCKYHNYRISFCLAFLLFYFQ